MRIFNLSSGSEGNSTYIETDDARILVDAGISCTEILKRLELIGVKGSDIDVILLSHEHVDHTRGVEVLSNKFKIPVYANDEVWKGLCDKLKKIDEREIKNFSGSFEIKDLIINPFEVPHDVKCFGFSFQNGDRKASILTDLGHTTEKIFNEVEGSSIVYLESNHDVEMLKRCEKYPLSLKMRILGSNGHLSNNASADFAKLLVESGTRQLVLSHLSKNTNTPEIAFTTMCEILKNDGIIEGQDVKIDVATTVPVRIFRLK